MQLTIEIPDSLTVEDCEDIIDGDWDRHILVGLDSEFSPITNPQTYIPHATEEGLTA